MRVRLRERPGGQRHQRDGPQVHRRALQVHRLRQGIQARQIQPRCQQLRGGRRRPRGVRGMLPEHPRAAMRRLFHRDGRRRIVRPQRRLRRGHVRSMQRDFRVRLRRLRFLRPERVPAKAATDGLQERGPRRDEDREARVGGRGAPTRTGGDAGLAPTRGASATAAAMALSRASAAAAALCSYAARSARACASSASSCCTCRGMGGGGGGGSRTGRRTSIHSRTSIIAFDLSRRGRGA